jgi:outer membrane protein assembly factor BamB/dienelactone hydrolase
VFETASEGLEQGELHVLCFDRDSGRENWHQRLWGTAPTVYYYARAGMASPSPVTDGKHLWAFFGTGDVFCFDMDGALVWQRALAAEYGPFENRFGAASSPLLFEDSLILQCDHYGTSYVIALDKETGANRWKSDRPEVWLSWSSPQLVPVEKGFELVLCGSEKIDGYDPRTGERLWTVRGLARECVPTPVFSRGLLLAVSGPNGAHLAVRPGGTGDVTNSHVVWHSERGASFVPSGIVVGERYYVADDKGIASCFDAASGKLLWRKRFEGKFTASPVAAGMILFFTTESGTTLVVDAERAEYAELARNEIGEEVYSSPAISQARFFLRTTGHLICLANGAAEAARSEREALWRELEPFTEPPTEYAGQFGPYRSPLKFADGTIAKTPADWGRRRKEILETWHRRLGPWPPLIERPEVKTLETAERDGYVERHVHVQISSDGKLADGYLLVPEGSGPFPAVFVPFYEPLTSIGKGEKGRGTHDYGLQLVRRGFVTLSIGTPGSIEKIGLDTRQLLVESGQEQRRQPLTLLAYVAANCHSALAQMPEVDPGRIGIIGLSYGGKWSMFASCLYEKFACAVWSDPGIVFDEKNANVNYWEPWYLGYDPKAQRKPGVPSAENPRTGLYKELVDAGDDLVDLHALMAPRPVLVSGGTEDPPQNWRALNHLVAVSELLGAKQRVAMTARATHVPTPEALLLELAFLEYWLKTK